MANINDINDKDLCTNIASVNGKLLANLYSVNEILKSCATCSAIALAYNEESCDSACGAEDCGEYYTDGVVGSLQVDDHIYSGEGCTECAAGGFYSDNPCGGEQRACFTIDEECVITSITECR